MSDVITAGMPRTYVRDIDPGKPQASKLGHTGLWYQTVWWTPKDGPPIPLIRMSCRYKRNVHAFLLRRANTIEFRYSWNTAMMCAEIGGDMARMSVENGLDEHDRFVAQVGAEQWLRETPLLREILYQSESRAYDGPID